MYKASRTALLSPQFVCFCLYSFSFQLGSSTSESLLYIAPHVIPSQYSIPPLIISDIANDVGVQFFAAGAWKSCTAGSTSMCSAQGDDVVATSCNVEIWNLE